MNSETLTTATGVTCISLLEQDNYAFPLKPIFINYMTYYYFITYTTIQYSYIYIPVYIYIYIENGYKQ